MRSECERSNAQCLSPLTHSFNSIQFYSVFEDPPEKHLLVREVSSLAIMIHSINLHMHERLKTKENQCDNILLDSSRAVSAETSAEV